MRKICLALCSAVSNQWTSLEEHFKRLMSVDLLWPPKTTSSSFHVKSAIWTWNTSSAAHTGLLKQWPHAPVGFFGAAEFLTSYKFWKMVVVSQMSLSKNGVFSGLQQMPSSQLSGEIVPLPCLEGPADIVRHESRNLPPHGPLGDLDEAGIGVISVLSKGNETAMPPLNQWRKKQRLFPSLSATQMTFSMLYLSSRCSCSSCCRCRASSTLLLERASGYWP